MAEEEGIIVVVVEEVAVVVIPDPEELPMVVETGEQGPAGASSYQLWLAQGNEGTLEEYLLSLNATDLTAKSDTVGNISYIGTAVAGSLASSAVWLISRIDVAAAGSVTVSYAGNAVWNDRLTLVYMAEPPDPGQPA
jgi:hypothetical protein